MAAHAAAGNRAEALRVYEQCRQLLATELGAYPSPETESIYRELLGSAKADADAPETVPVAVRAREPDGERPDPAGRSPMHWRTTIAICAALVLATAIAVTVGGARGREEQGRDSASVAGETRLR